MFVWIFLLCEKVTALRAQGDATPQRPFSSALIFGFVFLASTKSIQMPYLILFCERERIWGGRGDERSYCLLLFFAFGSGASIPNTVLPATYPRNVVAYSR